MTPIEQAAAQLLDAFRRGDHKTADKILAALPDRALCRLAETMARAITYQPAGRPHIERLVYAVTKVVADMAAERSTRA